VPPVPPRRSAVRQPQPAPSSPPPAAPGVARARHITQPKKTLVAAETRAQLRLREARLR
jgi:hypothetical protein